MAIRHVGSVMRGAYVVGGSLYFSIDLYTMSDKKNQVGRWRFDVRHMPVMPTLDIFNKDKTSEELYILSTNRCQVVNHLALFMPFICNRRCLHLCTSGLALLVKKLDL